MSDLTSIKRKIQSILAKADDGSGATEAEAASAIEFARQLMMRHQLTEADLGADRKKTAHEVAADTEYDTVVAFTEGSSLTQWQSTLAHAIDKLIGTVNHYHGGMGEKRSESGNIVFDGKGQPKMATKVVFYGPADDCRDARELFTEWATTVAALARMKFGGALRGPGRSYAEGFCMALLTKVVEMNKRERALVQGAGSVSMNDAALVASNEKEGDQCTALVVAGALELIDAKRKQAASWLANKKGVRLVKRGGGSGGRHHNDAYQSGSRDGRNANFTRNQSKKLK